MNQSKRPRFRWGGSLIIIPLLVVACFVGGSVALTSSQGKGRSVELTNQTSSCLVSAERHLDQVRGDHVRLLLRNDSEGKSITAYVVTFRSPRTVFTFKEEFALSEAQQVIGPGQLHERAIPIPLSLAARKRIPLDLSAVVFSDKSSEGDHSIVQGIHDDRLGEKIQRTRVISLLEEVLARSDSELLSYFRDDLGQDLAATLSPPQEEVFDRLTNRPTFSKSDLR